MWERNILRRRSSVEEMAVVLAALAAVLVITSLALMAAGPLMRLFGDKVESVITRLLGVLLAALAAQYVIDGLRGAFNLVEVDALEARERSQRRVRKELIQWPAFVFSARH